MCYPLIEFSKELEQETSTIEKRTGKEKSMRESEED